MGLHPQGKPLSPPPQALSNLQILVADIGCGWQFKSANVVITHLREAAPAHFVVYLVVGDITLTSPRKRAPQNCLVHDHRPPPKLARRASTWHPCMCGHVCVEPWWVEQLGMLVYPAAEERYSVWSSTVYRRGYMFRTANRHSFLVRDYKISCALRHVGGRWQRFPIFHKHFPLLYIAVIGVAVHCTV